jgi:hypothetical protein
MNEFRQPTSLAGRYDNPIPTRCLAPIDCLKIPAQTEAIPEEKNDPARPEPTVLQAPGRIILLKYQ